MVFVELLEQDSWWAMVGQKSRSVKAKRGEGTFTFLD